jgi:hypothetical protein
MDDQQVAEILTKAKEPTNVATLPVMADFNEATMETIRAYIAQRPLPGRTVCHMDPAVPGSDVMILSMEHEGGSFYRRLEHSLAPIMVSEVKPMDFPVMDLLPRGQFKHTVVLDTECFPNANGRMYPKGVWDRALKDATFPVELMPEFKCLPKTVPPWLYDREHVCALEEGTAQDFSDNVFAVMEDTAYQRAKRIADVLEQYNIRVKFSEIVCNYLSGDLTIRAQTTRTTNQLSTLMRNKKVRESMWGNVTVAISTGDSKGANGMTHYRYQGTQCTDIVSDFDLRIWHGGARIKGDFKVAGTTTGRWRAPAANLQRV